MAPGGGGKRKRNDRNFSQDSGNEPSRPSPHRPGNLDLARQGNQQQIYQQYGYVRDQQDQRGGRRRASRGGRGGGPSRSPMDGPNSIPVQPRSSISVTHPMSSPSAPTQRSNETPITNAATTKVTEEHSSPSKPYSYEYVINSRTANWREEGRDSLVNIGASAYQEGDFLILSCLFQELVRSVIDGRVEALEAGSVIRDILGEEAELDADEDMGIQDVSLDKKSIFLDCLSILTEVEVSSPALRILVLSTGISPLLMRRELESSLLENLGMIRNTFVRVGIRQQTNLLYRQSNYNLLREETEGYSKLITELFTTSSSESLTSDVVEETFERVRGMIGAFDLDVGRVLDVTLDVFAAVLVKQYRFFVKYLRASSWWPQDQSARMESSNQDWNTLPKWALPGSSGRPPNDEERESTAKLRDERDAAFWHQVKEIGIDAFFEIGGRRAEKAALEAAVAGGKEQSALDLDNDRQWVEATGTLPPTGNKVAAQILGFKLRFYSSSARDPTDVLPVNLIYLAALLIKIGFISLRDLYPHLWPADVAMEAVREEKMKEKAEQERLNRPGARTVNALMTAGALADDTIPSVGVTRETASRLREAETSRSTPARSDPATDKAAAANSDENNDLPEPSDQKVQLLKSLLCIGAIPESLYMLGRFPWLPDAFPELPEYIHRILNHCLSKVYEPLRPMKERTDLSEQHRIPDPDQSGVPKSGLRLVEAPVRKTLRWAQLDRDDTNDGIDYKFYWDDWADNIPVCQSVDDVFLLCSSLLNLSGVKIGQDSGLLLKLARIGSHSLTNNTSEENIARWIDLSKRLLVPALSLTKCNPGVVNEVFELIKQFPTTTRYSIYAEWNLGQISRLPDIKSAFEQTKAETKDVLKRISKTSIKPMARALAKSAYSSPGAVFSVAIAQLQAYANIIDTLVECARYFTYLGYDVLTWSILTALGASRRDRVQADGMLTSQWLQAVSLFAGRAFKRYSTMNPTTVLQYVNEQLRKGISNDLIVLEELTTNMAGIVSDTNFNEAQILAMAGGDLLRTQTMTQLLDRRNESKITARRYLKSLVEPRLAGQILISVAQERKTCIFKIPDVDAHPKILGNLFDEVHKVLMQYLEFLQTSLSIDDFQSLVPGVSRLILDFGIEPNIAFWISRPSIVAAMLKHDADAMKKRMIEAKYTKQEQIEDTANVKTVQKLESQAAAAVESGQNLDRVSPRLNGSDVEEVQDVETNPSQILVRDNEDTTTVIKDLEDAFTTDGTGTSNALDQAINSDMEMNVDERRPEAVADAIGGSNEQAKPSPFTPKATIIQTQSKGEYQPWHPVLRDIMGASRSALPESTWEVLSLPFYVTFWQLSLGDLHVPTQSYDDEINRLKKKVSAINNDRSDISIVGTQRKDRERKAVTELQDRLRAELKDQIQVYTQTRARLQKEKEYWFSEQWGKFDNMNIALIEHCFLPRIVISHIDALYSFKMLKFLHSSGATNFRTMGVLDQVFREKRLTSIFFLSTAKEVESLARFLNEVLKDLSKWHADKALFEKEAFGTKKDLPGFAKKLTPGGKINDFYGYEEFRRVLLKWHRHLNGALKACFSSGEYMHIRNAINVLKIVHLYFPAVNWMGRDQVGSITELSSSETREDLKLAAASLLGNLRRREKEWMLPQAFSLNESSPNGSNGTRVGSARAVTPQPRSQTPRNLNALAPEFKPSSPAIVNGATNAAPPPGGKTEAEDGEIDDLRNSNAAAAKPFQPTSILQNPRNHPDQKEIPDVVAKSLEKTPEEPESLPRDQTLDANNQQPTPTINAPQVLPQPVHVHAQSVPTMPVTTPPPTVHPSVPARPDVSRGIPTTLDNGRSQHALPSRPPEMPFSRPGDHRTLDRLGDRTGRDNLRDQRNVEYSRSERKGDSMQDRFSGRHTSGPLPRNFERPFDRQPISNHNRTDVGRVGEKTFPLNPNSEPRQDSINTRDQRLFPREDRSGRALGDNFYDRSNERGQDTHSQTSRPAAMAPPRAQVSEHPVRVDLLARAEHPARAALIHGLPEPDRRTYSSNGLDNRSETSRYEEHPKSERNSRAPSPSRYEDRRPQRYDDRREDRPGLDGRRIAEDIAEAHIPRHENASLPTGPRSDRSGAMNLLNVNERYRETWKAASSAPPPPVDLNHGRLNQDAENGTHQQDTQHTRSAADHSNHPRQLDLHPNRPSDHTDFRQQPVQHTRQGSDVPSGPRLPNGNLTWGGRNFSAPQTHQQFHMNTSTLPSPNGHDRHTPTGPSVPRAPVTVKSTAQALPSSSATSAPVTPVGEVPDTAGIHPERLRAIQGTVSNGLPAPTLPAEGVRHDLPELSPIAPGAPRASNMPAPSPGIISPSSRFPPTGPSSQDRGRGDKRFAGIQNMLQQASVPNGHERNGQGASIRGRGGRMNSLNMPSPTMPDPPAGSGRGDPLAQRSDLFVGRSSGPPMPQHGSSQWTDDHSGGGRGGYRGGPINDLRDGERRSGRHRFSRSHSRDRHNGSQLPPRGEERRPARDESRDRARGAPGLERDSRRPGRDDYKERERRGDSDRRGPEDWNVDRRGAAERNERDRRDVGSGRKRGHMEDGAGDRGYEGKRPRRNQ